MQQAQIQPRQHMNYSDSGHSLVDATSNSMCKFPQLSKQLHHEILNVLIWSK